MKTFLNFSADAFSISFGRYWIQRTNIELPLRHPYGLYHQSDLVHYLDAYGGMWKPTF